MSTKEETDALVFYVATDGDDGWSGKLAAPHADRTDGPFATLVRARDAIRETKAGQPLDAPVTVLVRGGKYYLDETLVLGSEDSGTRECPITYQAYPGEKPILSGGRKVDGWEPYQGQILQCRLPRAKGGGWKFRQLFFNGQRQIRARYPNFDPENPLHGGWAFVAGPAEEGSYVAFKYQAGTFAVKGRGKHHWAKPMQAEVYMLRDWGVTDVIPIKTIDEENRVITLADGVTSHDVCPWFTPTPISTRNRFYVENVLEELDQPGEWCLDPEEGVLYFWPPEPVEKGQVVAPVLDCLVDLRGSSALRTPPHPPPPQIHGVSWITLSGFTFTETTTGDNMHRERLDGYGAMFPEGGRRYCGEALHLTAADHCCIEHNTFYAVGGNGIYLEGYNARNLIRNNEISHAGACGVVLIGSKYFRPVQRYPIYNQIVDNHIHHCGIFDKYVAGVFLGLSDGNVVGHNLIEDMPHHAINLGGSGFGRNILEYNEIHHACLETFDNGAINSWMTDPHEYTQRDTERSGHIIRYNRITDTRGCRIDETGNLAPGGNANGIYMDDYTSNCFVYGNLIERSGGMGGVYINGGKNNIIENNIIVDCRRQLSAGPCWGFAPQMGDFANGNIFCRNIVYGLQSDGQLYFLRDWPEKVIGQADHNLFFTPDAGDHTITVQPRDESEGKTILSFAEWKNLGFDTHSLITDPLFVDPEHGDYRLSSDSPAIELGFVPIDVSKIGIRSQQP